MNYEKHNIFIIDRRYSAFVPYFLKPGWPLYYYGWLVDVNPSLALGAQKKIWKVTIEKLIVFHFDKLVTVGKVKS